MYSSIVLLGVRSSKIIALNVIEYSFAPFTEAQFGFVKYNKQNFGMLSIFWHELTKRLTVFPFLLYFDWLSLNLW